MRKILLTICCMLAFLCQVKAQDTTPGTYRKAIYAEVYGQGLHASMNYDMRLRKGRRDGWGFRAGVGGIFTGTADADAGAIANGVVAIPIGVNYLFGEKHSSLEAGAGLAPHYASTDLRSPTSPEIINANGWGTNGFVNLGYRFQPLEKGLLFRLNWTPVITSKAVLPKNFALALGYSF